MWFKWWPIILGFAYSKELQIFLFINIYFQTFDKMLSSTQPGNGGKIGFYFTDTEIIPVGIKGCFRFDKDDNKV